MWFRPRPGLPGGTDHGERPTSILATVAAKTRTRAWRNGSAFEVARAFGLRALERRFLATPIQWGWLVDLFNPAEAPGENRVHSQRLAPFVTSFTVLPGQWAIADPVRLFPASLTCPGCHLTFRP
jgi:hypothetical protein